jgi:hypothetical protein
VDNRGTDIQLHIGGHFPKTFSFENVADAFGHEPPYRRQFWIAIFVAAAMLPVAAWSLIEAELASTIVVQLLPTDDRPLSRRNIGHSKTTIRTRTIPTILE